MKKIIIYLLLIILVCFVTPLIFTRKFESEEASQFAQEEEKMQDIVENTYDYSKYKTLKLLHKKTNQIEEVKLDDYICNVVSAEMPADFEIEALKAQSLVARTYTLYKIVSDTKKHGDADICDDSTCCQAWISKEDRLARWQEDVRESNWTKIVNAVNSTQGKIITYEDKPINAFFHSNSGGKTEIPLNVWGGSGYPYLQVVETSGEEGYSQYASEVELTNEEILKKIKEKYQDIEIDFSKDDQVKILENTDSGRVKTIRFGNKELSGVEARTIFGLKSANFEITKKDGKIKFTVIGYGHGVGMSQTGADSLAKQGKNYEEIIKHFYVGVKIENI